MECKITATKHPRFAGTSGVTLVEFLIAVAVGMVTIGALGSLSLYSGRTFAGLMNYSDLESASRRALDTMTKEIRQTSWLTSYSTNQLVFNDADGTPLTYTYNPTNLTLTRTKSGTDQVLLTGCESMKFGIFLRNFTNGTFDLYPTTGSPTNTKVVQVSWLCTRTIVGAKVNSESVQTAKIVIRRR